MWWGFAHGDNVEQHYLWAAGHFLLLLCSLRFFLAKLMFRAVSAFWYKGASVSFLGVAGAYSDVASGG